MSQSFDVAVITGGGRGIGAEIARRLAKAKFEVLILGRNTSRMREVCDQICSRGGVAHFLEADLSSKTSIDRAVEQLLNMPKSPTVLVNNAGHGGPFHRIDQVSNAEWEYIHQVNLHAAFCLSRALLPKMREMGRGRIVNIASVQGLYGASGSSTYATSKHALVGLTRSLAAEWGEYGITCNAICPGYIETEMLKSYDEQGEAKLERLLNRIPAKRFGTTTEIAALVRFLVGPYAGYINGATLVVDGGLSAHLE